MFVFASLLTLASAQFFSYWHNWASSDGETHLTLCNLTNGWTGAAFGPGQPPIFVNHISNSSALTAFWTPTQWNPTVKFHANPVVQWGFWVVGSMKFVATDGSAAIIDSQNIYLGDDVGSKGHHSENVGIGPALSFMVPYKGKVGNGPCWPSL